MPRILVVDDSPSVRNLLRDCLAAEGWDVQCAEDAEEGAMRALTSPPDVVVSDLWMPGLSGMQLCRLLHEDPSTAHVLVVLLSATSDRRSRFWAKRSGASAFLDKSQAREIPALVAKLLQRGLPKANPLAQRAAGASAVRASMIPARLSHLLDGALFDMVLTSEVRGLALARTELSTLFDGLATLVNEIVLYRWLVLHARDDLRTVACVHVPKDAPKAAAAEAMAAIGFAERAPDLWISDDRCAPSESAGSFVLRPIEHSGVELGSIAMGVSGQMGGRPQDVSVLATAAREIALPLRVVTLIERTHQLASTDALTKLPNRRSAVEALDHGVAGATRLGQALSVMIIDLDHFKRVNDTYGHNAGDQTLQHFAQVLRQFARKSDFVCRWGGEEFLMVLPATAAAGARIAGERVRAAIATSPVLLPEHGSIQLTASIGIATRAGENAVDLVERADRALYLAKRSGRNRVEVARLVED